jgi:hypothetical protein
MPMLRTVLNALAGKHILATHAAQQPPAHGTAKLDRRLRQMQSERRRDPKSVCTSLRDICEM